MVIDAVERETLIMLKQLQKTGWKRKLLCMYAQVILVFFISVYVSTIVAELAASFVLISLYKGSVVGTGENLYKWYRGSSGKFLFMLQKVKLKQGEKFNFGQYMVIIKKNRKLL